MDKSRDRKGFTLAELLITLIVTSILLSALSTLAFALSSAATSESDTAVIQAQLRQGTLRLQDLLWNCRLICAADGAALAIWKADDNDDGEINVNELVFLDRGSGNATLKLCQFASPGNPHVTLISGALSATKSELISGHNGTYISLIADAENVQFTFDAAPPSTQWITTSFDLSQNGVTHHYQIDTALRAWAGHLLNDAGDTLIGDDDE